MTIKEKEISINITPRNAKHYENLGYKIPKEYNKQNKLVLKENASILININDLSYGSGEKVTKICDMCGKLIPNQKYQSIIRCRNKNNGIDICGECNVDKKINTRKSKMKIENSFEYYVKENNIQYLLNEFSIKNNKNPINISYGTKEKYWWNCPNCGSEYDMGVIERIHGTNCPYCSGTRVNNSNCLWTTNPEVANILEDKNIGYKITSQSNTKQNFICPNCNNSIKNKFVYQITNKGLSCPNCSDGVSYPEKFMINFLDQLNIQYETQKIFKWSENKRYDFYIESLNCIIETHGEQHYNEKTFSNVGGRKLEEEQKNDRLKEKFAKENGIQNYIIIDCRKSGLEWIRTSIINSKISELFDLSNIDWLECGKFASESLVKTACDLWNDGIKDSSKISKILKLSKNTIITYLKKGRELNWCDYNAYEAKKRQYLSLKEIGKSKISKSVVQLSLNGEFIKEWKSIKNASDTLGINNISIVCSGKGNSAGGFKWMYKEDYEKQINKQ